MTNELKLEAQTLAEAWKSVVMKQRRWHLLVNVQSRSSSLTISTSN